MLGFGLGNAAWEAAQALAVLLVALFIYGLHPIKRWRYRHIPGPFVWPILGHLPHMLYFGQEEMCTRWSRKYGPIWCFWLGALPVVMTDDPELAKKVLARPRRHKIFSLHSGDQAKWDSHSIVFSNGEKWKVARNAWQPFFSRESVTRHGKIMVESADKLCVQLHAAAAEGREVDVWRETGKMTLDVVGTTAFGVQFNTLDPKEGSHGSDRLRQAVQVFFELFGLGNFYFALFFLIPELEGAIKWMANRLPNKPFRTELDARTELRQVSTDLVEQARKQLGGGASCHKRPSVVDPGSFLSLILPHVDHKIDGDCLGDSWASNQAATFILAGYETTANTIGFAIYLISSHPEHEARLLAELDAWGRDRLPTLQDLEAGALPFAQAVLNESLRMYPAGSTAVREGNNGMKLGGYSIPDLSAVQVSIFSMHRNERYWQDPEVFKPERFLPGTKEAAEVVPGSFLPFGDGSRKCVGYRFAQLEATLTLVKLYQKFTFRLLPGQVPLKVRTILTLGPTHGIRVTVHPR